MFRDDDDHHHDSGGEHCHGVAILQVSDDGDDDDALRVSVVGNDNGVDSRFFLLSLQDSGYLFNERARVCLCYAARTRITTTAPLSWFS